MPVGKLRAIAGGSAARSPLLASLQRGDIALTEYLEARVDEAIAPLLGKISADRIDSLRALLKEQLSEDPVLVELVRQATAREPQAG
jgi:hypothetical protein